MSQRFDEMEFVTLRIDGKTVRSDQIPSAVGLTRQGQKIIVGFMEAKTEAHSCVVALLQALQARGFHVAGPLLVLLDGSKGLRKGVRDPAIFMMYPVRV